MVYMKSQAYIRDGVILESRTILIEMLVPIWLVNEIDTKLTSMKCSCKPLTTAYIAGTYYGVVKLELQHRMEFHITQFHTSIV